jgi:hypothetical protein
MYSRSASLNVPVFGAGSQLLSRSLPGDSLWIWIVSEPSSPSDHCHVTAQRLERASWLTVQPCAFAFVLTLTPLSLHRQILDPPAGETGPHLCP